MRALFLALPVTVVAITACPPPPTVAPLEIPEGCQPLAADLQCGLPFPSDHFTVADSSMPSGRRVEITGKAELQTSEGRNGDITDFIAQDGFSRTAPIVWTFGVGVDAESLPDISADPAATTAAGAPIALIRASDGARVPFFVDIDVRATDPSRQALTMRPLIQLDEDARYVVAISGVVGVDGDIPVPEGFRRLREGAAAVGDDPILKPELERYEKDVFPIIDDAGIARADLQLAWDFSTGTDRSVMSDMLRARELVLAELQQTPAIVEVEAVFEGDAVARLFEDRPQNTWRFVELRITGPRVVETDQAGTLLYRDESGQVALNGTTTFDVSVVIPASVRDGFNAGPALLYGHGFFGRRDEVEFGSTRHIADQAGRVLFGLDWVGMSIEDVGVVSGGIGNEVSEALRFGERVPQAMMNWIVLSELIENGGLDDVSASVGGADVAVFRRPASGPGTGVEGGVNNANAPVVVGGDTAFLGISQGHILGGVQAALNARIRKVILQSGGASFSHMMFRARPFEGFLFFLNLSVPDPLDQQMLAAQLQRGFDRFDPSVYAPYVRDQALDGGPDNGHEGRQILLSTARGDSQVPNLGTFLHARYLKIPFIEPSAIAAPFGLDEQDAPQASGLYVYDMGIDPSFEKDATFPEENDVHGALRSTTESVAQMRAFLRDGAIIDPCAPGGCGVVGR